MAGFCIGRAVPRRALVATLLLALVSVPAARSEPVTYGPNLDQYSDTNTNTCINNPFKAGSLPGPSCTWTSLAATGPRTGGQGVLATGTISQVKVKVGATTGKMQVVVMRYEAQISANSGASEPQSIPLTAVAASPVFTPAANTTTTIPVELPTKIEVQQPNPQTLVLSYDFVGLSVLEEHVPVPAAANVTEHEKVPSFEEEEGVTIPEKEIEVQPHTLVADPALQTDGQSGSAEIGKGFLVLMDFTFTETPGAPTFVQLLSGLIRTSGSQITGSGSTTPGSSASTPGLSPTPHAVPKVSLATGGRAVRVKADTVFVHLACSATAPCDGTLRLRNTTESLLAIPAEHKHKRTKGAAITYAVGRFAMKPGSTATVKLKLTHAGRTLARRHRRRKVWLAAALSGVTPSPSWQKPLKLRF